MKKLFFIATLLIALMLSANVEMSAQKDHLKFAGIPLDGTISQFHPKIVAKGFKYDAELSKQFENSRAYNGVFAGENCLVYVYYDTKSKIVYRAKAIVENLSQSIAEQKFDSMKSRLCAKYTEENSFRDNMDDSKYQPSFAILPLRDNLDYSLSKWKNTYGIINIYVVKSNSYLYNSSNDHSLHIDYEDQINSDLHEKNIEDDL
jgi:hypothetical protein